MSSYVEAIELSSSSASSNTYTVDITHDWSIASSLCFLSPSANVSNKATVPHGGHLITLAALAVKSYMQTHQAQLKQPDLITSHVEFISCGIIGLGTISITPLKFGCQFSTLRVQLLQHNTKSNFPRLRLEALITQGNLASEAQSPSASIFLCP